MIDLRRLHVLRAVAHYGTVTAAARALHFTPSAASQQIRQLARDLDVDLLFEGEADLAVVEATPYNPPLSDARFDQQPLLDDPFDLVVPADHPLAGRERIDLSEAAHEDWIAPMPDSPCSPHVLSACGEA